MDYAQMHKATMFSKGGCVTTDTAINPVAISLLSLALNVILIVAVASLWQRVSALEKERTDLTHDRALSITESKEQTSGNVTPKVMAIISGALAVYLEKDMEQLRISSIKRVT